MKNKIISLAMIGGLALLGCEKQSGGEKACTEQVEKSEVSNTVRLDTKRQREAGVVIDAARPMPLNKRIAVPARVDFDQSRLAHLTSRVAGRVDRVSAFLGDRVKAGQTLAAIYSQEFLVAQSEFIQAEQRIDRLTARGDTTDGLASAKSIRESARQKLLVMGASEDDLNSLTSSRMPKAMLDVRAPFDGTVVEADEILGHVVEVGAPLFHVADLSNVWLFADVHEKDISFLTTGMDAVVEAAAYPGVAFKGRLTRIFDVVDDQTRTLKTRIEVGNGNLKLKPGMFATATLTSQQSDSVLAFPLDAVQRDGEKRFVFVAQNDSTFVKRIVEVGDETPEGIGITGGLREGEKVAIRGGFALKSEMLKASFGGGE